MKKLWKKQLERPRLTESLGKQLHVDPLIAQLLVQRGITTVNAARAFLTPDLCQLHDPFLLKDMSVAVQRLDQAIQCQESILLYGDYDVDGTTAVAMMHLFLEKYTQRLDYYIPDRKKEGYGISLAGIDYAAKNGVGLILAMDCGIKAIEAVAYANSKSIEVIICDHHLPDDQLPAAVAVIDPQRKDDDYPFKVLCGCGVSFKLAQAYLQYKNQPFDQLYQLLDLVAIGTACDIVPMIGENRVLTYAGLQLINHQPRPGIKAILESNKRGNIQTVSDLVFGVGPVINAAGRLGDAKASVQLLMEKELSAAQLLAGELTLQNEARRAVDKNMLTQALELIDALPDFDQQKSIVLFHPDWHQGVIGIVASRLTEIYHRPTILLTTTEDGIVGSARSVSDYDIHQAIGECGHLLINFGGHAFAAGLRLVPEQLAPFKIAFEQTVCRSIQLLQQFPFVHVAAVLPSEKITLDLWQQVQQLAPFGPKNRKPVFVTHGLRDTGESRVLKNNHLKLRVVSKWGASFDGIGFGLGHHFPERFERPLHLCYTLEKNEWKGKTTLQLNVKDIH